MRVKNPMSEFKIIKCVIQKRTDYFSHDNLWFRY